MTYTKATAIEAMRQTFDSDFVEPDFRSIKISLEYPVSPQDYPSIWVDFEPLGSLSIVGIGHSEFVDADGGTNEMYRWRFAGHLTFTAVAMTSLERDRLIDSLIKVFAFSRANGLTAFRQTIEAGTLIALNADFDQVELRGFSTSSGTPWGTDEMIYEGTVAMEIAGEFVNTSTDLLLDVSGIETIEWTVGWEDDPTSGVWQSEI